MSEQPLPSRSYVLTWQFEGRVATQHLGSQKYTTSSKAIAELVANSLDAGATRVEIDLRENDLGGLDSIVISDNGTGIAPETLRDRFRIVGVLPTSGQEHRLGRLGVGRLAVHRIGDLSKWTTTSTTAQGKITSTFTLSANDTGGKLKINEVLCESAVSTGTMIEIFNLRDSGKDRLTSLKLSNDLSAQYCSFLLGNPGRQIMVCGEAIDVTTMVDSRELELIPASETLTSDASLTHLLLKRAVDHSRFPDQVLFAAKGRTITTIQPDDVPANNYLGLVDCEYLDSIVSSNRELLIEIDEGFSTLRTLALQKVETFGKGLRSRQKTTFIEHARRQEYYPYRVPNDDPIKNIEQAIYDVALERINEGTNLGGMTKKQQELVFRMLRRSLHNEDLLEVLQEVAKLSDEDVQRFRKVLERTTLESIIRLSSEVSGRLSFLDIMDQLIYGQVGKVLKERRHLHKILDPHCWIFGAKFHLATSDQSFREIIRQHRKEAGLTDVDDEEIKNVSGVEDIPDLFLASSRHYPIEPKHHHLLVELKAPSKHLGRAEVEQIRRYAEIIMDSHQFDKHTTRWDLFLVSACATKEIDRDRKQKDLPYGRMYTFDNMDVWAFEWSEIISNARTEMQLVNDQLKRKSQELTVSDYLKENFPEILADLSERIKSREDKRAQGSSNS
jgi:hypothetical protein